jgi:S-DNA-T family DNA segregation ATPase FtsK/SpoIIIE
MAKKTLGEGNLKREILGILLAALGILLTLSLISYNPHDPSFNNQPSEPRQPTNLIGLAGSYIADICFQIFGWPAFIWPLLLIILAFRSFRQEV